MTVDGFSVLVGINIGLLIAHAVTIIAKIHNAKYMR